MNPSPHRDAHHNPDKLSGRGMRCMAVRHQGQERSNSLAHQHQALCPVGQYIVGASIPWASPLLSAVVFLLVKKSTQPHERQTSVKPQHRTPKVRVQASQGPDPRTGQPLAPRLNPDPHLTGPEPSHSGMSRRDVPTFPAPKFGALGSRERYGTFPTPQAPRQKNTLTSMK